MNINNIKLKVFIDHILFIFLIIISLHLYNCFLYIHITSVFPRRDRSNRWESLLWSSSCDSFLIHCQYLCPYCSRHRFSTSCSSLSGLRLSKSYLFFLACLDGVIGIITSWLCVDTLVGVSSAGRIQAAGWQVCWIDVGGCLVCQICLHCVI